ncbi:MAG: M3 family oligoendopeptidase, partial [Candidatus Methylomirabilales bacterium]
MSTESSSAAGVRWDLSDLFASPEDPGITASLAACRARAQAFAAAYRGSLRAPDGPDPSRVLAALQELEALQETLGRAGTYAGLLYASDTANPVYRDLRERVELAGTEIGNLVLFFDLEWMEVPDPVAERLMADPVLASYRHHLAQLRRFRAHTLSEAEERLLNERDNTGRRAFGRLFTELTTSLSFPLTRDGREERLTMSELLALVHDEDRDLRRRAYESLFDVLSGQSLVLTFVYDTLIQDQLVADRLRRYPHPMAERNLGNEIDEAAVEQMLAVTEANYGVAQRYFRRKAALLGLPRLALHDQYAPVGTSLPPCSFERARAMVLEAFGAFEPGVREIAERFFTRRWIDAEVRPGKQGGAFCASPSPALHPYVLCNHTDNLRDVMTLAHELGHGLHGWLARAQTLFNYDTPLTLAETASVFAEFLVFDHLLARETDPGVRLALLAGKIEDTCATVFRQTVLTRFEQAAFRRRGAGRLTADAVCQDWLGANRAYYGDALELPEAYRWGWAYIPHFIHSRFYCYAYVFGELLVLSLYRQYKEEGRAFVPKYLRLLEAGGSDAPERLLAPLGVDFRDAAFWQRGFEELKSLVAQVEALAAEAAGAAGLARGG